MAFFKHSQQQKNRNLLSNLSLILFKVKIIFWDGFGVGHTFTELVRFLEKYFIYIYIYISFDYRTMI